MCHRLLPIALFVLACLAPGFAGAQTPAAREAEARARLQAGQTTGSPSTRLSFGQPPDYYKTLPTPQLAEHCLESFMFGMNIGLLNDNRNRLGQLRKKFPDLDDLFRRYDLMQGVAHVYDDYAKALAADTSTTTIVKISINLDCFEEIYNQPEFRAQLPSRERQFLKANLALMRLVCKNLERGPASNAETLSSMSQNLGRIAMRLVEKLDPPAATRLKALSGKMSPKPTSAELIQSINRFLEVAGPLETDTADAPFLWAGQAPRLTEEQAREFKTEELARICFASSVFAREIGKSNDIDPTKTAFPSLERYFPCFNELFHRQDLWKGVLGAYALYLDGLLSKDAQTSPTVMQNNVVGLQTLHYMYSYPAMAEQMKDRERLFFQAHLRALKRVREYVAHYDPAPGGPTLPRFAPMAIYSLVQPALKFMDQASPEDGKKIRDEIDVEYPQQSTREALLEYLDPVIKRLESFAILAPLYPDSPDPVALVGRLGSENLDRDAEKTWQDAAKAIPNLKTEDDIPREYWAPAIRDLHPEAVYYLGGVNIAVVLKSGPRGEEGLVFMAAISNIIPRPEHIGGGSLISLGDAAPGHISGSSYVYTRPARHAAKGATALGSLLQIGHAAKF